MLVTDHPGTQAEGRLTRWVIALGLAPAALTFWILWLAPLGQQDLLATDRTALAGRDFTVLWTAGQLAATRAFHTLSDPAAYTAYLRALFGPAMPEQIWPYPPPMLLLARLCAGLPLLPAMLLYTGATLLTLLAALRVAGLRWGSVLAVLLSPAVASNALTGQNGALIAALLVAGLALVERRPILAGILLGALCIKPQFALLVPVCVLARLRVSTAASGCIISVLLALMTLLIFGVQPWAEFVAHDGKTVVNYAGVSWQASPSQALFTSVFMAARALGCSTALASAAQAVTACLCAFFAWRLWSNPEAPPARLPATLALTLLASPWVHLYDMPALAAAIVMLLPNARFSSRAWLGFAWLLPGLAMLIPTTPLQAVVAVAIVAAIAFRTQAASPSSA